MTISPVDDLRFIVMDGGVNWIVDIGERTCSCRKFDYRQLPCSHALAACRYIRLSHESLCSTYYTSETLFRAYSEPILPVGQVSDWIVPEYLKNMDIQPPIARRQSGRRRMNQILSQGEEPSKNICSRCRQHGHNRQTCRNPVPLQSR